MQSSKQGLKGVPFSCKMVYKRVRGWTSGWSLPVLTFVEYTPGRYADRCLKFFFKARTKSLLINFSTNTGNV